MAGSITFAGRDMTAARPHEIVGAGIVHVPQGRRLFPGLTVRENLLQGAFLRRDAAGVEADLEWVYGLLPRLKERAAQLAGRLSGGEQQMCAIGRGLMSKPRLLIVDELSLGLAPLVVDHLLELITQINGKGTTVLPVEQDCRSPSSTPTAATSSKRGASSSRVPQRSLDDPRIRQAYLGL